MDDENWAGKGFSKPAPQLMDLSKLLYVQTSDGHRYAPEDVTFVLSTR